VNGSQLGAPRLPNLEATCPSFRCGEGSQSIQRSRRKETGRQGGTRKLSWKERLETG